MKEQFSMETEAQRFRNDVYSCCDCANLGFGFTRPNKNSPLYKFPPTIGAKGEAPLLFIGINPRISKSNCFLHMALMSNPKKFNDLACNRYGNYNYIAINGMERHYNIHALIASSVFPGKSFEDTAAVTELFLCAKETSEDLPLDNSPCADKYLDRTINQVKPRVIIPLGRIVLSYLQTKFSQREDIFSVETGGHSVTVIPMNHPSPRAKKIWPTEWTIEKIRAVILRGHFA